MALIHILIQFFFSFIYPLSALVYISRVYICIEILFLNTNLISTAPFLSNSQRGMFIQYTYYFICFILFLLLIMILKIRPSNECGQHLIGIYTLMLVASLSAIVFFLIRHLSYINKQLFKEFGEAENALELIQRDQGQIQALKNERNNKYFLLICCCFAFIFNCVLRYAKYNNFKRLGSNCSMMMADHSLFFDFIFCVLEFFGLNIINFCIYYEHFYKLKNRLFVFVDVGKKVEDAFANNRSMVMKNSLMNIKI